MTIDLGLRPIIVVLAGPNGAGKTTFFDAFLRATGLRFVNADVLARELNLAPYAAAVAAERVRLELVAQRESFVFETVLSDPVGEKVEFLKKTVAAGYNVVLCFIGIADAGLSDERVAMRVSQGGHDVPQEKIAARFPRTLLNLQRALRGLPHVIVYDNSDLRTPYRRCAEFVNGVAMFTGEPIPHWLKPLLTR